MRVPSVVERMRSQLPLRLWHLSIQAYGPRQKINALLTYALWPRLALGGAFLAPVREGHWQAYVPAGLAAAQHQYERFGATLVGMERQPTVILLYHPAVSEVSRGMGMALHLQAEPLSPLQRDALRAFAPTPGGRFLNRTEPCGAARSGCLAALLRALGRHRGPPWSPMCWRPSSENSWMDPQTQTLDPASAAACLTPRPRAIMPVPLGGRLAAMDALMALAPQQHLVVLEDAAQAWGAAWQGRRARTLGHAVGFRCQSSKHLTAGAGGMMLTNDPALGALARALRPCGRQPEGLWYAHDVLGGPYRLSEFHGALRRVPWRRSPAPLAQRQANTASREPALAAVAGLTPLRQDARVTSNAYPVLCVQYPADAFGGASQERFVAARRAAGLDGGHTGSAVPVSRPPVLRAPNVGLTTPPLASRGSPQQPD